MLGSWAAAAARLTSGEAVAATEAVPQAPPIDTGEAFDLGPAQLTVTVGFGPSLFDGRFGLAARRPAALAAIPELPGDALDPDRSAGDVCVQACSNDPQVAFHVIRRFARIARGTAVMRWSQLGFGRTSSTSTTQRTPRNLMGFKDGTNNVKGDDTAELERFVWVGEETD
jgi:deferrochelatase/peroxidase EfeB